MAAGHVVVVGAVALGLASLLNAETLREMAERQPFDSSTRGVALAVTRPLERLSQFLSLDRPGEAFDAWRGRDSGGTDCHNASAAGVQHRRDDCLGAGRDDAPVLPCPRPEA